MQTVKVKFLFLVIFAVFFSSCSKENGTIDEISYKIGDEGPAGGIIIYVDNSKSSDFTYIEVSLDDIGGAEWGCFNAPIVDAREPGIGMGKENSLAIVDFHNNLDDFYNNPAICSETSNGTVAAKACTDYVFGGFDDWFLPSEDETLLMYNKLHLEGLGNFDTEFLYWSSTEHGDNTAVTIDFSNGDQGFLCKQCDFGEITKIRAVRYF